MTEAIQEKSLPIDSPAARQREPKPDEKFAAEIDHLLANQINPADSIIVSGFWRSGTTWLQEGLAEILQAKTVFEPFHFRVPAAKKLHKYYGLAQKSESVRELFIPYCAEAVLEPHSLLYHYYDSALRANLSGRIVRLLRQGVSESYRTRVLVKFTRGQFSLHAAQNTFAMPLIHVYRDPRAVIASAKMTDWYSLFDELSLPQQLLEVQDGRAEFFLRCADEIRAFDHDKISRMAAYWAITERFLCNAFAKRGQSRTILVSYEELCRDPALVLDMLAKLQVQMADSGDSCAMNWDSFSTSNQRRGVSSAERISGWKKVLSRAEAETIASIAKHFGFDERLVE